MIAKLERKHSNAQQNKNRHRAPTTTANGKHTKQQINSNRTFALEWRAALTYGGLTSHYSHLICFIRNLCTDRTQISFEK